MLPVVTRERVQVHREHLQGLPRLGGVVFLRAARPVHAAREQPGADDRQARVAVAVIMAMSSPKFWWTSKGKRTGQS